MSRTRAIPPIEAYVDPDKERMRQAVGARRRLAKQLSARPDPKPVPQYKTIQEYLDHMASRGIDEKRALAMLKEFQAANDIEPIGNA